MRRIFTAYIGARRISLLRLAGLFVVLGAGLGFLDSVGSLIRLTKQLELAQTSPEFAMSVFKLPATAFTEEVVLGFLAGPLAFVFLWIALFCIGVMVYKSDRVVVPIESS